jgi:hypothetical protein
MASGLTVQRGQPDVPPGGLVADRSLCLDRSQSVLVEDGTVEAKWLLAGKGQVIPASEVKRLDLRVRDGRVVQGPAPEPVVVVDVAPLEGIVHPAGAMPEPKRGKKAEKAEKPKE